MTPVSISFKIEKADKTGRWVAGWLSVVQKGGKVVEDSQGDRMSMDTLRKGVHKYMRGSRVIKKQHSGDQIGEMSEIIMIDDDFAKAHGITHTKRGAWGVAEITDADVQKSVARGDVTGWSMGGKGKRVPIVKARGIPRLGGKGLMPKGEGPRRRAMFNAQDNKVYWGSRAFRAGNKGMDGARDVYRRRRNSFARIENRLAVRKSAGFFSRFL
jgi:hypothetical protein